MDCMFRAWAKRKSSSKTALLIGGVLISSASLAVECTQGSNGSVTVNNANNTGANINCEVSSILPEIGNTSIWNTGFLVYSQNANRSITLTNDLTTTLKGSGGFQSMVLHLTLHLLLMPLEKHSILQLQI
jgi:hypothetical protein